MRRTVPLLVVLTLAVELGAVSGNAVAEPAAGTAARTPGSVAFDPYVAYPIGSWPESAAVGDFTGDGRADVAVSTSYYFSARRDFRVWLFRQKPDGTLRDPVRYATDLVYGGDAGLAAGDLDGDGDTDLALATEAGIDLFMQDGGTLAPAVLLPTPGAQQVLVRDVIGDLRSELVVNTYDGVTIFKDKQGTFVARRTIPFPNHEVEVGDVTGDGLLDLVGSISSTVYVRAQGARGHFGPAAPYTTTGHSSTWGLEVADLTHDGIDDAVVTHAFNAPDSGLDVFAGLRDGTLATPVPYPSYDIPEVVEASDLDGDGRSDVVTLHGGWEAAGVYLQAVDGTLGSEQLFPIPYASHFNLQALAFGDVNGDGTKDVVYADYNNGLVILPQA